MQILTNPSYFRQKLRKSGLLQSWTPDRGRIISDYFIVATQDK